AGIADSAEEVRLDRELDIHVKPFFPELDKDLLNDFFGFIRVFDERVREGAEAGIVVAEKFPEDPLIALHQSISNILFVNGHVYLCRSRKYESPV
ncbi:MAG TPA: hypothetical protein PLI08_02080, partial [Bacteroidia bacterium]|nr:hypothetical protein [Bacteroidia bacterium]